MTKDHNIFQDQLAEYLADGLTPAERTALEAHLDTCAICKQTLNDLKQLESDMTALFASTQPDAQFESRLVGRLRLSSSMTIHPLVRKASVAVAASVLLGGFGYVASQKFDEGKMPVFSWNDSSVNRVQCATNLREVGAAILLYQNDQKGISIANSPADSAATQPAAGYVQPSSTAEKWNFGGGSNAKLNWANVKEAEARFDPQFFSKGDASPDRRRGAYKLSASKVALPATPSITVKQLDDVFRPPSGPSVARVEQKASEDKYGLADKERIGEVRKSEAVANLVKRSRQLSTEGRYDEALGVVDQILVLDKKNDYATGVRPLIVDRKLFKESPEYREKFGKALADVELQSKEKGISYGDVLRFPETWPDLSAPRDPKATGQEEEKLNALKLDRDGQAVALQDAQAQPANPPAPPAQGNQVIETAQSKIIRNGEVEFEVDSFDSAAATVAKIVNEESGYIGTTNSEKLPNGKVRGTLVVRVKPDHLDTLVLKLRGLGELKKQNLTANDVTKQYYDIAAELRAAHAMQERLLEIIKTGNAQVKDLLNVEKELATWRGKIEKLEGEIRYYDSLVSLSTLTISLQERDIRTASAIKETEQADAGIEVADVETARTSAIKAVEEAKGRIIEAELKKFDAGQFAAKVVADVPSEAAGAVIDRLKQIGKVARLEITRKQTTPDNTSPLPGAKIEKGDTRIIASFYNLANIAPRQTVTMQLACDNVAKTYADVLSQIEKAGGRVVTSNLQQPQPDQTSGTIQFELPTSVADASLMQIQQAGTSLQLTVSENPDTANVTAAKRGFNLSLIAADAIPARQGVNISAETSDVIATTGSIQMAAESLGGKIVDTNQSTTSNNGSRSTLRIELPSAKLSELLSKIESTTKVRSQQSRVRADIPNSPTARAQVELNLATPETLVASDSGFGASLRKGFATSAAGLLWSLQLIVIGLCLVGPWVVLLWAGMKFWKRKRAASAA